MQPVHLTQFFQEFKFPAHAQTDAASILWPGAIFQKLEISRL